MAPFLILLGVVLVVSVMVGVAVSMTRDPSAAPGSGARPTTRFFLVMLRLAIGWHFLIEGFEKVHSESWSSEVYLRESTGPLAPMFRAMAGDRLRDRLLVADQKFPEPLAEDWRAYFDAFQSHYELTDKQRELAKAASDKQRDKSLAALTVEKKVVSYRTPPPGAAAPSSVELTVQGQIQAYDEKLREVRKIESEDLARYGPASFARLQQAKGEANKLRSILKTELTSQTASFKKALEDVLTSEQKQLSPPGDPPRKPWASLLDFSDFVVKWGLVVTGICLLAGVLTRTFCVVGAGFLLMFFLAMPPLPGWPENPRAEGHYLYINKNIIEMLALLALATTRSGRWAGLDAAFGAFKNWCCPAKTITPTTNVVPTKEPEESTEHLSPNDVRTQMSGKKS